MPISCPIRRPAAAFAALALAAGPAAAFEPTGDAVADAFLSIVEAQTENGSVSASGASTEGDVTTIRGFAATTTDDGETLSMTSGSVAITDGVVADDGSMTAERLAFADFSVSADPDPFRMRIAEIAATDVRLDPPAAATEGGLPADEAAWRTLRLSDITLTGDGEITVEEVRLRASGLDDETLREGTLAVSGVAIPMATIEDEDMRANLDALGYDGIAFDLAVDGTWAPANGVLDLTDVRVTARDMGVLTFNATLGGLTEDVLEKLQAEEQNPDEQLAMLNNVTVTSLTLAWADAGLASRVLGMMADSQGTSVDALAGQLAQALPAMLSAIGNEAFEAEVADAAGSFLQEPGTLTVTARPQNPVPIAQIVGAAMMSPGAIPTVLGVSVSASE